jgi:hypothetical protein
MTYLRFRNMWTAYSRSASESVPEKSRDESTWRNGTGTVAPKRTRRRIPRPRWTTCSYACVTRLAPWSGAAKSSRRWSTSWSVLWMRCRKWSVSGVSQTVSHGAHGGLGLFTARPICTVDRRHSPILARVSLRYHSQTLRLADHLHATLLALGPPAVLLCATQQLMPVLLIVERLLRASIRPLRGLLETPRGGSSTGCSPSHIHRAPLCRRRVHLPRVLLGCLLRRVRLRRHRRQVIRRNLA